MRIILSGNNRVNSLQFIRRCGYNKIYDRKADKYSYTKRLSSSLYPRFHLYVLLDQNNKLVMNLHLDQKKIKLAKAIIHAGDYQGEMVKTESDRIVKCYKNFLN